MVSEPAWFLFGSLSLPEKVEAGVGFNSNNGIRSAIKASLLVVCLTYVEKVGKKRCRAIFSDGPLLRKKKPNRVRNVPLNREPICV